MSQMLKSTGAMGAATFLSRVLGMVREIVYANFMGDTGVAGAFKTALMIPNLFRRLLGEGALTAAFIPIFKEKEKQDGEAEAWKAANAVISGLIVAASLIIGVVILGISLYLAAHTQPALNPAPPEIAHELAAQSARVSTLRPETQLMLELTRLMFPYMLLVCLAAVLMGMLNSRGHFFIPALGAAVLNLILIGSVFWLAPRFGKTLNTQIFGVAYGLLFAGAAQAFYQLPTLYKDGFRLHWVNPFGNPTVKKVVHKMIPGMMGVAAFQLNVLTTTWLAFMFEPGMVASFDYAVRLMEFPQGIFAISLATFLLPTLSGLAAEKKFPEFRATYKQAVGYLFFVNLLASVLLLVLAQPMIRLLFQHGEFDASSTHRAAFALSFLGPGLLAFSMVNITARAFYALGDTQTPMKISSFCLLVNILFAVMLIPSMRQGGMALANTLSAALNVYLLIFGLKKKLSKLEFSDLTPLFFRMSLVALLAGFGAWSSSWLWENYVGSENLFQRIGAVFVPISVASGLYVGLLLALKTPQAREATALLKMRLARRKNEPTL